MIPHLFVAILMFFLQQSSASDNRAEQADNAKIILDYFKSSGNEEKLIGIFPTTIPQTSGLYLISYKYGGTDYPMYVGEAINLENRFTTHRAQNSGIKSSFMYKWETHTYTMAGRTPRLKIETGPMTTLNLANNDKNDVHFKWVTMEKHNAKWMESAFLAVFDFAFNIEENGAGRYELDATTSPGVGVNLRAKLQEFFDELKAEGGYLLAAI